MPKVSLTDRFCAGAKSPDAPQKDFMDAVTTGLALRVSKTGHKAWCFHYSAPDGKRARVQIGTYPGTSLAQARTLALELRGQLEGGIDPRAFMAEQSAEGLTIRALIGGYIEKHVRNLRSATAIERRIEKNVLPVIGTVKAADLHKRDVNRVLDPILERGASMEAARVFEDMRAAFRWAVARGDLDHSPMEGMRKPASNKPRERVLSDDEIRTLWQGLPVSLAKSKACQRIIKLCLVTAQRVGEVSGMRRDELDLTKCVWSLPGERTKNAHAHLVPLSPLAVSIIKEALNDAGDESPFVFPCGDSSLDPEAVARTITRANQIPPGKETSRFGIAQWTAHDLRRTALTNFAQMGVPPIVAGAVANHLSVTKASITLSVYTKYTYDAEKREALDLWAERLGAIIQGGAAQIIPMKRAKP